MVVNSTGYSIRFDPENKPKHASLQKANIRFHDLFAEENWHP